MAPPVPSETSPLLGAKGKSITPSYSGSIESSSPPTAEGASSETEAEADVEQQNGSSDDEPKPYAGMPEVYKRLHVIFPAMAVGVLLSAADQTIIVSSYGKIGTDLNALETTSWIATSYFLTLTAFQPLYGKLSDIFSRKSCLLFAYTVFGLGCVLCGLAPNIQTLIAARAFAGIGGGGMLTLCSIIMSDVIPLRERGTWQGYMNMVYATGAGVGAPLGGLLADSISWRWAFLAQGPLCVIPIIAVAIWLNLPKKEDSDWKVKLRRIDFVGTLTLICAVFALLVALDRGSNVSWSDKFTLAALGSSIPLFILFVVVEMRFSKEPLAPGQIIFGSATFACYMVFFFTMAAYIAAVFYIPLYWQAVLGASAAQAGLQMIPQLIAATSGSLVGGIYIKKKGTYKTFTVWSYAFCFLGIIIIPVSTLILRPFGNAVTTIGMVTGMVITSFTAGIGSTTVLISLIGNVDPADQAVATACSYLFRSLGSVVGISLSATISNLVLRDSLTARLGHGKQAGEITKRVRESLAYLRQLEPDVKRIVVECYAHSTRCAFALQVGFAFFAAVSVWWIREKQLSK